MSIPTSATEPNQPRIVVGIAEAQQATLRFAVDEAHLFGLDIEVVHCAGYTNYAARVIDQLYFENWLEAAEHVLNEARRSIAREFSPPRSFYRMSDHAPVDELLQAATEAAEVVVGSDNPSWFSRMLGPGVAQIVARTAACPVVVVPENSSGSVRAHGVVVGIEGSKPEEHVLRYAFEHADRRGRELVVLHALPPDAWIGEVQVHKAAVAEALAGWSEKFPDVAVTRKFVEGDAARVCAKATMNAELVVVGQPRPTLIPFALEKPLSHGILKQARCPVAVIPDSLS